MKEASEIVDHARKHFEVHTWSVEKSKLTINGEMGECRIQIEVVLRGDIQGMVEATKLLIEGLTK